MSPERSVLIVDDDRLVRSHLRDALHAFRLFEASTGAEALEVISREHPDLVLLDLVMPEMSGLEVLLELQRRQEGAPVVVVSTLDAQSLVDEAMDRGARGFVLKPFHPLEIVDQINRLLPV